MSQHMEFEEANRQQQQEPNYSAGYGDPFLRPDEQQKIYTQSRGGSKGTPAGMRLALAIVSVSILVPITAITLTTGEDSPFGLIRGLIALGAICLTIMVINIAFNFNRH
jgi:hypothetical protein